MIEYLQGLVLKKVPAKVVILCGGVGYGVELTLPASDAIPPEGEIVTLSVYLNVKEDALELYGFQNESEKEVFLKLISVSGIGPRTALRVLSSIPAFQLAKLIQSGDVSSLIKVKGIGRKTAEVMVATLRSPLAHMQFKEEGSTTSIKSSHVTDAEKALVTLGVKESQAQNAVAAALKKLGAQASTSQLIAQALQET